MDAKGRKMLQIIAKNGWRDLEFAGMGVFDLCRTLMVILRSLEEAFGCHLHHHHSLMW